MKNRYLAVDVFFILSGFILCFCYAHEFKTDVKKFTYIKFMLTRVARIWPLLAFTCTVHLITYISFNGTKELGIWVIDYIMKVTWTAGFTSQFIL